MFQKEEKRMFDHLHAKFTGLIRALVLSLAFVLFIPAVPAQAASRTPGRVTVSGVTTSGSDKVVIRWKKADSATSYRIYYKESGAKKWTTLANVSTKTLTYSHKSSGKYPLKAGQSYYYMVRGYNKTYKTYGGFNKTGVKAVIPSKPQPTTDPELAISPSEDFSDASQQDTDLVLDETDTFDDSSEVK